MRTRRRRDSGSESVDPRSAQRKALSKRLYDELARRRWSQSDLARQAGLSRDQISTYITARSLPSPVALSALAATLGCAPEELVPSDPLQESPEMSMSLAANGKMQLLLKVELERDLALKIVTMVQESLAQPGKQPAA